MTDHLDRRAATLVQDLAERLERVVAASRYFEVRRECDKVRTNNVVLDALLERVMRIKLVLPPARRCEHSGAGARRAEPEDEETPPLVRGTQMAHEKELLSCSGEGKI